MTYMCTDRIYRTYKLNSRVNPALQLQRESLDAKWGGGDRIQTNVLAEAAPKSSPRTAARKMDKGQDGHLCACDTVQGSEVT